MEVKLQWCFGVVSMLFLVITTFLPKASAIGCFVCSSVNGSEPDCEDTFNNTGKFYQPECMSGRKERSGLFPGTDCVKMKATLDHHPWTIMVRQCVVDSGGTNSETEIGRSNHCGLVNSMMYNYTEVKGCILSCGRDGCNTGYNIQADGLLQLLIAFGLHAWITY